MNPTEVPAMTWLCSYIRNTFPESKCRHLLLTGRKNSGKTTLVEALLDEHCVPGICSRVELGGDGLPVRVVLEARDGSESCVIGNRRNGKMLPEVSALDGPARGLLLKALEAPGRWVCVDEIGFLEEASALYKDALWELFERKNVLAVLRKEELPFINKIKSRGDCMLLDLDGFL